MKRLIILMTFLAVVTLSYAQTSEETENWLRGKLAIYALNVPDVKHTYSLTVENGQLYMAITNVIGIDQPMKLNWTSSVYIDDIIGVSIHRKESSVWIVITSKDQYSWQLVKHGEKLPKSNKIEIILSPDVTYNGLDKRIVKAFEHLIEINGGELPKEVF
jgi:hypothetical protein